jgi:hypothetical protein
MIVSDYSARSGSARKLLPTNFRFRLGHSTSLPIGENERVLSRLARRALIKRYKRGMSGIKARSFAPVLEADDPAKIATKENRLLI